MGRMKRQALIGGALIVAAVCAQAQERAEGEFHNYRSGFNRDNLALQVLLDRQNLSCNCVDGIWGARTEIALVTWQTLNGLPVTGIPDASVLLALGGTTNVLTRYTVTEADLTNGIAPVPVAWDERARLPAMRGISICGRTAPPCLPFPWPAPRPKATSPRRLARSCPARKS